MPEGKVPNVGDRRCLAAERRCDLGLTTGQPFPQRPKLPPILDAPSRRNLQCSWRRPSPCAADVMIQMILVSPETADRWRVLANRRGFEKGSVMLTARSVDRKRQPEAESLETIGDCWPRRAARVLWMGVLSLAVLPPRLASHRSFADFTIWNHLRPSPSSGRPALPGRPPQARCLLHNVL